MTEKIIQIFGILLTLLPYTAFCFIPFTGSFKIKMRTFYIAFAGFSLALTAASLLFSSSRFNLTSNWNIYFICMLTVCFIFYFLLVRVRLSRFIYVCLIVATFAFYIAGICNYLEIMFYPDNFNTIFSPVSTLLHAVLLLILSPFFIYFLKKQVKPIANQTEVSAWKTMWIIPGMFLTVIIVYMGSYETELISSWQYIVILLFLASGSFIIYSVVLKMLKTSDQNAKLTELANELKRQREMRDTLLQNVSHDLRTPIAVIRGAAEILSESELDEADGRALSRIVNRTAQLEKLVEDLIELDTIGSGSMLFKAKPVGINVLIEDIVSEYRQLCEDKGLFLRIIPASGVVLADKRHIWQVFDNLITNALKFTESGGITVSAVKQDGYCLFCVKDTGRGIPPDKLEFVFDRFYHYGDPGQGSGLGLSIVRSIVEGLGGKVWVESESGKGSAFFFTLKLG